MFESKLFCALKVNDTSHQSFFDRKKTGGYLNCYLFLDIGFKLHLLRELWPSWQDDADRDYSTFVAVTSDRKELERKLAELKDRGWMARRNSLGTVCRIWGSLSIKDHQTPKGTRTILGAPDSSLRIRRAAWADLKKSILVEVQWVLRRVLLLKSF